MSDLRLGDWRLIGALLMAAAFATGCGTTDDRPATWNYLSPAIFQPGCATVSCHSRATAVAGLDFSTPDHGYTSLTALTIWVVNPDGTPAQGCQTVDGTVVCAHPNRPLVVAFNPAESRLVNMLRARGAPRMPPDRPLPEADIALVERWILDGARRTPDGVPARVGSAPVDASIITFLDSGVAPSDGGGDGDGGDGGRP
jgi:hypothetical protein